MSQSIFQERLRLIMNETQTTQKALASALGIKPQSISQYANGQSEPSLSRLKDIAVFFNVSADWLIGISDDKSRHPSVINDYGLNEAACNNLKEYRSFSFHASHRPIMEYVNRILSNPVFWETLSLAEYTVQAFETAIYYETHPEEYSAILEKLPAVMENVDGEIHHAYYMYSPEFWVDAERYKLNESTKILLSAVIQEKELEDRLSDAKQSRTDSSSKAALYDSHESLQPDADTSQQGSK